MSASRDEEIKPETPMRPVLIWDAPVRVFHWLFAACFVGAYLSSESERWQLVHITLGYTAGALVLFRIVWGLIGTRHARFASFVRGPAAAWRYLRSLPGAAPEHHAGHNPAGGLAIVLLLALAAAAVALGWAAYNEFGGDWIGELHETTANLMLGLVGLHLTGVVVGSVVHRENLVRAMLTGRKAGMAREAIARPWRPVAVVVLLAVLGFWWLQWQSAPSAQQAAGHPSALARHGDADDD